MTKQDAKRWVCDRVRRALAAGLVEDEAGEHLSPADQERVEAATEDLIEEMERRARGTTESQDNSIEDH